MDLDFKADYAWVLGVQRKLYRWSKANPKEQYRELWNWVTDIRNLRYAWNRVARNKGKRTPGIDGITVGSVMRDMGVITFLKEKGFSLRLKNISTPSSFSWLSSSSSIR